MDVPHIAISRARYDVLMAAAEAWNAEYTCECPKCGRLHRYLANNPPKSISGEYPKLQAELNMLKKVSFQAQEAAKEQLAQVGRLRAEKKEIRQALWDLLNDCINFDGGKLTDSIQANASAVLRKYAPNKEFEVPAEEPTVITITRARYDALMAAAKAISIIHRAGERDKTLRTWPDVEEEFDALRAAGVTDA